MATLCLSTSFPFLLNIAQLVVLAQSINTALNNSLQKSNKMYIHRILACLAVGAAFVQGQSSSTTSTPYAGPATTATGLPAVTYQAIFPPTNFKTGLGSDVTGNITLSSTPDKPGVHIAVALHGLPAQALYGPFIYHVHAAPVPADGNCTATLKHLDPTYRGEQPACDARDPASCQVGDLSGKHGNITTDGGAFAAEYHDDFLSTDPASPAFFADKSVVVHTGNATRITCANFAVVESQGGYGGLNGTAGFGGNGTIGVPTGPKEPKMPTQTDGGSGASPSSTGSGSGGAPVQSDGAAAVTVGGLAVLAGLLAVGL